MSQEKYVPINIHSCFSYQGKCPYTMYLKLGENKFTRIINKGDILDLKRIHTYIEKGVKELWIEKCDRLKHMISTEKQIHQFVAKKRFTDEDFHQHMDELSSQCLNLILEDKKVSKESYSLSKTYSSSLVLMSDADITPLTALLKMVKKKELSLLKHLISTSIFSVLIARADKALGASITNKEISNIAQGGLLHDIGLCFADKDFNENDKKLGKHGLLQLRSHLKWPFLMNSNPEKIFSKEVTEAILQHHEAWDGSGIPSHLKGEEIAYSARVIAVADAFEHLTRATENKPAMPVSFALMYLLEDPKLDPRLVRILNSLFQKEQEASPVKKSA